jgi:hypothetical protein
MGFGRVAEDHEMEFVYAQLYPWPQVLELPLGSSIPS